MKLFEPVAADVADRIRRRFPPVPAEFSKTVAVDGDARALVRPGMPRPKLRGVPIPATSLTAHDTVNIIESDTDMWRLTIAQRRCDLCAEPLDREDRIYMAGDPDPADADWIFVRGGMHRRCFKATCHWCVHIRERLLEGSMCAGSISYALALDPAVFEIRGVRPKAAFDGTDILGEYRVRLSAVRAERPFRDLA